MSNGDCINFGRYASQTEQMVEELNPRMEDSGWITQHHQQQQKTNNIGDIPSLMSIPTQAIGLEQDRRLNKTGKQAMYTTPTFTPGRQNSNQSSREKMDLTTPQRPPGLIQRPTKLSYDSSTAKTSFLTTEKVTPTTPDVLVQINRIINHQESLTGITPAVANSSGLTTPGVWSNFSPNEWPSKIHSTWPTVNVNSPSSILSTQIQNPFASISSSSSSAQSNLSFLPTTPTQLTDEDDLTKSKLWPSESVWSTPILPSTSATVPTIFSTSKSPWNDLLSSSSEINTNSQQTPNKNEKDNNSWLFWQCVPDTNQTVAGQQIEETTKNKDLWSPLETISLNSLTSNTIPSLDAVCSVLPSSNDICQEQQQHDILWSSAVDDVVENNGGVNENNENDNKTSKEQNVTLQSKWEFAR